MDWPNTGDRVAGEYMGQPYQGNVTGVSFESGALGRRYSVRFDAPINVSKSAYMTIPRQNVRAVIDEGGVSVDHKGRPDGIMTLARASV